LAAVAQLRRNWTEGHALALPRMLAKASDHEVTGLGGRLFFLFRDGDGDGFATLSSGNGLFEETA
jgi:hypothetical protein